MNVQNLEDIYELSPVQQGMLFHTLCQPTSGVYLQQLYWTFQGDLDIPSLKCAWQQVIHRHAVLRTAFHWQDLEQPYQVVSKQVELPWQGLDWRQLTEAEQNAKLATFLQADQTRGFELSRAPLMRLTLIQLEPNRYRLIWSYHHLLLDGWSLTHIYREVLAFYTQIHQGETLELAPPRPFRDYIIWQRQQDLAKAEEFWRRSLQGISTPTSLAATLASSLPDPSPGTPTTNIEQSPPAQFH
ncbi:MAG: non-ribosomal peptide synthetase, partial [Cyanothece sp. SIO1E1]|nr:non-ribosomal peptide synthetase [Cyanothece sp. SIO1E1]